MDYDWIRALQIEGRHIDFNMDISSFEPVPKEATTMAARGPASVMPGSVDPCSNLGADS